MLVHDENPFEEQFDDAVVEHLVIRAKKMVVKHRRNAQYDDHAELRSEREDVRLAAGYGV
jgi:Flp pilus assembly CpaF family ATPase